MGGVIVDGRSRYAPRCPRHKHYRGLREGRNECEICRDIRAFMRKYEIKEHRSPWSQEQRARRERRKRAKANDQQSVQAG